jgi:hypothetical protein
MLVRYLKQNSPIKPVVDNNWKIVGVDLQTSNPDRAKLVALVNRGLIAVPYNTSLNLNDAAAQLALMNNVSVNGKTSAIGSYKTADGATYYRLRDLAAALTGTSAAFNVEWKEGRCRHHRRSLCRNRTGAACHRGLCHDRHHGKRGRHRGANEDAVSGQQQLYHRCAAGADYRRQGRDCR